MEKYFLHPELDFEHLRKCLDEYETDSIFIRWVGHKGGELKLMKNLEEEVWILEKIKKD